LTEDAQTLPSLADYRLLEVAPAAVDYCRMREIIGWREIALEHAEIAWRNSLYTVSIYCNEEVVGCGRIIGDGALHFYLQDIIVLPAHQGLGLGRKIMVQIFRFLEPYRTTASVHLMCAQGAEGFYRKFGFHRRTEDRPGMTWRPHEWYKT